MMYFIHMLLLYEIYFGDIKAYYANSLPHTAAQLIITLKILCVH